MVPLSSRNNRILKATIIDHELLQPLINIQDTIIIVILINIISNTVSVGIECVYGIIRIKHLY